MRVDKQRVCLLRNFDMVLISQRAGGVLELSLKIALVFEAFLCQLYG